MSSLLEGPPLRPKPARRLHREVGWDHPERLWTGPAPWKMMVKTLAKPWEKHRKTMGKWKNHGKIIGKPWENGKTVVKTWKNRGGKTMENDGKRVKPPKQNNWRLWYNLLGWRMWPGLWSLRWFWWCRDATPAMTFVAVPVGSKSQLRGKSSGFFLGETQGFFFAMHSSPPGFWGQSLTILVFFNYDVQNMQQKTRCRKGDCLEYHLVN